MNRRAVVLSLSGVLLMAPPSAGAATLTLDKPCYRGEDNSGQTAVPGRSRVGFTGAGFTPGAIVYLKGASDGKARASGTGTIAGTLTPSGGSDTPRPLVIEAEENEEPYTKATATSLQVGLGIKTDFRKLYDKQSRPMIRASGFYGGKYLYAHVNGGKNHRDLRLGRVTGPCGQFAGKRGPFLKRRYPGGRYRIQFDTSPKFSRRTRPKYLSDDVIAAFPFGGFR